MREGVRNREKRLLVYTNELQTGMFTNIIGNKQDYEYKILASKAMITYDTRKSKSVIETSDNQDLHFLFSFNQIIVKFFSYKTVVISPSGSILIDDRSYILNMYDEPIFKNQSLFFITKCLKLCKISLTTSSKISLNSPDIAHQILSVICTGVACFAFDGSKLIYLSGRYNSKFTIQDESPVVISTSDYDCQSKHVIAAMDGKILTAVSRSRTHVIHTRAISFDIYTSSGRFMSSVQYKGDSYVYPIKAILFQIKSLFFAFVLMKQSCSTLLAYKIHTLHIACNMDDPSGPNSAILQITARLARIRGRHATFTVLSNYSLYRIRVHV